MKKLFYFSNLLTLCLILSVSASRAQAPTISIFPIPDTVCLANTVHTASFTAFSSDTAVHYYWEVYSTIWDSVLNGALYSGATTGTITFTPTAAMNGYFYRAKAYNGAGMSAYTPYVKLTVDTVRSAGVISGLSTVCESSTMSLTTTGHDGMWVSSNANATVSSGGVVTGVSGGTATISYDASNSCGIYLATHAVTINPIIAHATLSGPSSVCISSSIGLTASVAGGTWTVSNGHASVSATGSVTGLSAGTDTVTYTNAGFCNTDIATKIVTVDAPVSAGGISGPSTVCVGSVVPFTPVVPGGFWLSGDGSVATVDLTGNVTGRGQGTTTISYAFSNSCGSFTAADTITVERTASAIVGSDSLGVGTTMMLSDSAVNGMWMSSDTAVAKIDTFTGLVHGITVGTATMLYSVTNICGTTTATILVHVGTAPGAGIILGQDSVCLGNSITLTDSISGGTWGVTNANGAITAGGVFTGLIGRVRDTVTYTVNDGFGTTVIKKAIYINTPPVVTLSGPTAPALGAAYTLGATPGGGVWTCSAPSSQLTFISAATIVILVRDTFDLVYTVSNTCGTTVDTFVITLTPISTIGVENVNGNANAMNIYPNPSTGAFSVNLSADMTEDAHVVITNMVGEVVKETTISTNKATGLTLSAPAGMYMLSATTAHDHYTSRIIIAK